MSQPSQCSPPSSTTPLRPPYDPLLLPGIEAFKTTLPEILDLTGLRSISDTFGLDGVLKSKPQFNHEDISVPGLEPGDDNIILGVFSPKNSTKTDRAALYVVHGGGQVSGHRFVALETIMGYLDDLEAVVISVEYRLAPEHRAPAALYDAYAGLVWTAENASRLGIDASKIIVSGGSGGAPIAMGSAMLCRNNQKKYPCALMLLTPMLDDRDCTASSKQFARDGPWCGTTNRMAWDLVLGTERGGDAVSELVAPARATDLEGLPPTFIDAGACEVFRDEAVAVASVLWKCGVSAELHVWPGAYHGFDMLSQEAPVSVVSTYMKTSWLKRIIAARDNELAAATSAATLGQKDETLATP
ncbi:Alpha/Beta hydrolase protein [Dactylonectria estremocensis]|uniref:Alpha/Beta hydrolase protein n=1 Tax=Dactylonectria estremocensis TaxID=1079267 RepID=A0A9P9ER12_9HYPO|nr:Alpha/Beta hydrolase protein [Dactylonectria estremocensis]